MGPIRQFVGILALVLACFDAYYFSAATVPLFHSLALPSFVAQALGGLILAMITYVAIATLGGILFKKTSDQKSTVVWFAYGASGSLVGIIFGAIIVLAASIVIRIFGTLADVPAAASAPKALVAPVGTGTPGAPPSAGDTLKPAISGLVQMKHSLDQGIIGEVLHTMDPIPKTVYATIGKVGRITASPSAITRFLSYPGAKDLVSDPDVASLREDPDVAKAAQTQDLVALMRNPKLVKAFNNPKLSAKLKNFEFQKALDYALPEEASPGVN